MAAYFIVHLELIGKTTVVAKRGINSIKEERMRSGEKISKKFYGK